MAKEGIELRQLTPLIRERCKTSGWAVCIGAGTSRPVFPGWRELVERLIERDVGVNAATVTANLADKFSYDALIQAAQDRLGYDDKTFTDVLTTELYRDVKNSLRPSEWLLLTDVLSSLDIGGVNPANRSDFLDLVRNKLKALSAIQIAEVVSEVIDTNLAPSAILSFNAEPLLYALINAFAAIRFAPKEAKPVDIITHGISNRKANRIPYYFCHGLLPVPNPKGNKRPRAKSPDKLVFSETNYLQLANSAFSWQSSVFIDVCSSRSVVFIGVSLSDPNMRRWLSWIHDNRVQELKERGAYRGVSTSHLWINTKPASDVERAWIESCVAHLGVRLVWINSWNEMGQGLRLLLGK